ncbi:exoribonuclease II [Agarivorans litoreus]|uniref:exoribonuclease II n=1 Tax=Agarivorans litoreus TaxID=1510455 RepID=UPI001C7CE2E3|nr:exoribonuclease II [Agarivorans litoreus]
MLKDNPLLAQLKQQIRETIPTVEGVVKATEKNFGFLQTDNKKSYFISPPMMKKLIHGDRISAAIRNNNGKEAAEPETLVEAALDTFVARVKFVDKRTKLQVDHPLINQLLSAKVIKDSGFSIKQGDWVLARLVKHALKEQHFQAEIFEFIAESDDNFARWKATTKKHQLAWDQPELTEDLTIIDQEVERRDLTNELFFTIDGENTKDMDDAVSITREAENWKLKVAIADPSAYINSESELEKAAKQRAFTLYLPARTVPMMPSKLANEHCSLVADQVRPALVCEMLIGLDGELHKDAEFYLATVQSKHRLNYNQVSDFIEQNTTELATNAELAEALQQLNLFSEQRNQWRAENTSVFGDQADYEFVLDNKGQVIDILRQSRRSANRMIEEAMVAANICGGRFLDEKLGFGVFACHSGFKEEKLDGLVELLAKFELPIEREKLNDLDYFCQLRRNIAATGDKCLDQLVKRHFNFGVYNEKCLPHFGLGEAKYATWTSPIRKYSDLLNHRLIKSVINGETPSSPLSEELSEHLSENRKKQKFAEREMANYLYCEYFAEQDPNTCLLAEISNINRGGLNIRLVDSGASAFVPKTKLAGKDEELTIETELGRLATKDKQYSVGDTISVKIVEVKKLQQSIVAAPC